MISTMLVTLHNERSPVPRGIPRDAWHGPSGHDRETRKELSIMASETDSASVTRPEDVGLKREVGFIGAVWASESSIIGSGWLFGALYAAQAAGPAATRSSSSA